MKDQLIDFQTAKLAKEKGFIGYISKDHYRIEGQNLIIGMIEDCTDHNFTEGYLSAPSQSLLQKWLREEHGIIVFVAPLIPDCLEYGVTLFQKDNQLEFDFPTFYNSYELALEAGLVQGLILLP